MSGLRSDPPSSVCDPIDRNPALALGFFTHLFTSFAPIRSAGAVVLRERTEVDDRPAAAASKVAPENDVNGDMNPSPRSRGSGRTAVRRGKRDGGRCRRIHRHHVVPAAG